MTAHGLTVPRTARVDCKRAYVRLNHTSATILLLLAEDCTDTSYVAPALLIRRLGGATSWAWLAICRLEALGRIEGSWRVGWRLTVAGWRMHGGEP